MIIVPMIKGECGPRHTNWHFDPRVSTAIGLGVSGTCVQYDNNYSLTPALICKEIGIGPVAIDFAAIIPEPDSTITNSRMASEIQEFIENCSTETLINTYNLIFGEGSAAQNTQPTADPNVKPYRLRPFAKKGKKLSIVEFKEEVDNGCISAKDGFFYYAVASQETTLEVNFSSIDVSWPFVIWYKKE